MYLDGGFYEGMWDAGVHHGCGLQQAPSSRGGHTTFIGEFERGIKCGHGVFVFHNGTSFLGQLLDERPHGYGMLQVGCYLDITSQTGTSCPIPSHIRADHRHIASGMTSNYANMDGSHKMSN